MLMLRSWQCTNCPMFSFFSKDRTRVAEKQSITFMRYYQNATIFLQRETKLFLSPFYDVPIGCDHHNMSIYNSAPWCGFPSMNQCFFRPLSDVTQGNQKRIIKQSSNNTKMGVEELTKSTSIEEKVAYFPKPESSEEKPLKGNWGLSKFIFYLLAHSIPIGCGIYAFKVLTENREANEILGVGDTPESIVADILKIIRGGASCFCLAEDSGIVYAVSIDPHYPEERVFRLPDETVIPGFKNNALTDALIGSYSDFALPLNFIHFAVKNPSVLFDSLIKNRRITLLYHDQQLGFSITLKGWVAIVESKELKRHYWRNVWGRQFSGPASSEYILLKFVPHTMQLQRLGWESSSIEREVNENTIQWASTRTQQ